jgi:hypothetical protein
MALSDGSPLTCRRVLRWAGALGLALVVPRCSDDDASEGVYSGMQGDDRTFLRGVQVADSTGTATFRTIFPGWYQGRALHIHLKVIQAGYTWTGQLFFDEQALEAVYALEPYSERGPADVSNGFGRDLRPERGSTVVATELVGDRASSQVTIGVERA